MTSEYKQDRVRNCRDSLITGTQLPQIRWNRLQNLIYIWIINHFCGKVRLYEVCIRNLSLPSIYSHSIPSLLVPSTLSYTEKNLTGLHCRQRIRTDTLLQKKFVRTSLDTSAIDFTISKDDPPEWKLRYGKLDRRTVRLTATAWGKQLSVRC